MKILMVNKFLYPNGGSETYMLKLGEKLKKDGHEVQYFGMADERNTVFNNVGAYVPNVDFHNTGGNPLNKIKMAFETIYSKAAFIEITKVLEDFKPHVVHMNNINFQLTPSIIYACKKYGVPVVQTVHDVQIACPCHRFYIEHEGRICEECTDGKYSHCVKNKCLQGSLAKSAIAAMESYYYHRKDTYNLVDLYICPSKFIAKKIIEAGVEEQRVKVIYNFSDVKKYVSGQENIHTTKTTELKKYALYFGRLSQEKGIMTLLDVIEELKGVKLVVAGGGPLEEEVKSRIDTINQNSGNTEINPPIEFAGFKTGEDLTNLISNAAFSIYPSEWYENCPLSVIESQSLGTPVIGSDLGGTEELIVHGKTGLVFKGCNKESLKDAILKLAENDLLVEEMSRECKNINVMNLADYEKEILEIYSELEKTC